MLNFKINEDNGSFHIQDSDGNNQTTVVQGYFAWDRPDAMILIVITQIVITPQEHQQLYDILSYVSKIFIETYNNRVFLRLSSTFDGQIDMNVLNFNENQPHMMAVNKNGLKYIDDKLVPYDREKYLLVTDKHIVLDHSEELFTMLKDTFWAKDWINTHVRNLIESATAIAVILDRSTNVACGLGRLFMVKGGENEETSLFGYLSHIVVQSGCQGQGLGRIIVNSLVNALKSSSCNSKKTDVSLFLFCAHIGSGAVSAPRLYRRFGFEFMNLTENAIAVFGFENPSSTEST